MTERRAASTPRPVGRAMQRIGQDLATWRKLRRLTVAEVADRAGISESTPGRLENGRGASLENVSRSTSSSTAPACTPARCSPTVDAAPSARRLSTTIDEGDDTASLQLALEVAGAFRLTDERARAVLAEVVRTVADRPAVATRHGLSRRELVAMQPAFAALDASR